MGYRLKTSLKTKEIFDELNRKTGLKPFALSKLSIAISLKKEIDIESISLDDTDGLELNRQTILGEDDYIYKCLIEENIGRSISDDEFYPYYCKKHMDRGAKLLSLHYTYNGNFKRFFESLLNGDEDI